MVSGGDIFNSDSFSDDSGNGLSGGAGSWGDSSGGDSSGGAGSWGDSSGGDSFGVVTDLNPPGDSICHFGLEYYYEFLNSIRKSFNNFYLYVSNGDIYFSVLDSVNMSVSDNSSLSESEPGTSNSSINSNTTNDSTFPGFLDDSIGIISSDIRDSVVSGSIRKINVSDFLRDKSGALSPEDLHRLGVFLDILARIFSGSDNNVSTSNVNRDVTSTSDFDSSSGDNQVFITSTGASISTSTAINTSTSTVIGSNNSLFNRDFLSDVSNSGEKNFVSSSSNELVNLSSDENLFNFEVLGLSLTFYIRRDGKLFSYSLHSEGLDSLSGGDLEDMI